MNKELQKLLDNSNVFSELKLHGEIVLNLPQSKNYYVGKSFSKNLLTLSKPNIVIDGTDAVIRVDIDEIPDANLNIFLISGMASNIEIKNLRMYVYVNCPENAHQITGIFNMAYGVRLINCSIEMISENPVNLFGIHNNGNLDTHLETRADNLIIERCNIKTQILKRGTKNCRVYGIYNNLANSISVQNNYIFSCNIGIGCLQSAVGIFTNGRFGRFGGNNIKANGSHNKGNLKEQASSYGFINEGLYNLLEFNNIVGEWGGLCIGLENKGEFANVTGNKILSTHTVQGRTVRNNADNCIFNGNILTSTSRNPRLFEQSGKNCIISSNLLIGLQSSSQYYSSVGIYAEKSTAKENIIIQNIIKNVCDCGIFIDKHNNIIQNNLIKTYPECTGFVKEAINNDLRLLRKLDENSILSIFE